MKYAILYHPRTYHEENYRYYYVPYSILSIAAALDDLTACRLYDNNVFRHEDPRQLDLPDPADWASVWVSAMIGMQVIDGLRFSDYVKSVRPDCPVVWGGACPTLLPELVVGHPSVDFVVIGQGEITARELWTTYSAGGACDAIPGVATDSGGTFFRAPSRNIVDLNNLPPYRHHFGKIGVAQYVRPDEHIAERTVNYHSSQGCPFSCGFCCEPVLWSKRWTGLGAQRIVDDLTYLVDEYGVNGIKFHDSEFFIEKDRVLEFADRLVRDEPRIRWGASVHPRNVLRFSESDLQLLKTSGVSRLLVGAETANQSELRLINKRIDRDTVRRVARICGQLEVSASFTFVTGYPGSPLERIDETLEFAEELTDVSPLHEAKVHFYGPYPGTPLYSTALAAGFRPPQTLSEWAHYDYYNVNTPWVPPEYFTRVRTFNESHYPYLLADERN